MSARCAKALIEGGPRRIFGYFLCEQKVTSSLPSPRRAEPLPQKISTKTAVHVEKKEATMYLHIGQSVVVPYRQILGIFDLDNASWA